MVYHQQLPDTFVADAVLAGQDQGVGEELLAAGADQLPLDVLDGNLETDGTPLQQPAWMLSYRMFGMLTNSRTVVFVLGQ